MYKDRKILALIPARGGSKCLPGKNILMLSGKPLIAWTIEEALKSKYLNRVMVSTDSEEIAVVSKTYGASVPFLRPQELATDEANGIDVVLHMIDFIEKMEEKFDLLIVLQPTSPLRTVEDINKSIESFFLKEANAIVSVCLADDHPYYMNILPEDGNMEKFINKEALNTNRQDLPVYYKLNGSIYMASFDFIKENIGFFGKGTFAYVMPKERSVDIDSKTDFEFAELILQRRKGRSP